MLSIFSCTDWPFVYILWETVYLDSLPIFKLGYFPAWILAFSLLNGLTFNYVRIYKYFSPVPHRNTHFKMFLSLTSQIVSNFSHHFTVKIEETDRQTFMPCPLDRPALDSGGRPVLAIVLQPCKQSGNWPESEEKWHGSHL